MPLLTFLSSFFGAAFTAFVAFVGRKVLIATASIAAALALTIAFVLFLNNLLTSVIGSLVLPPWIDVMMWFVPGNFNLCISVIISANIARAAYDLGMEKIRLVNAAT